jgi:hypothetical protein
VAPGGRGSGDLVAANRSELEPLWIELPGAGQIGTGHFRYCYAASAESPLHSVWLFDFYGAHFAGGYTSPIALTD